MERTKMLNRRNNLLALLILGLIAGKSALNAQTSVGDVKTVGNCSPVVIQPKGGFQIVCYDSTLSREEALKQAKQISELLSRLRATSQDGGEVTKKLDEILRELGDMKVSTSATNLKLALERAPIYTTATVNGVATPDLTHGFTQRVLLDTDGITIALPRLPHLEKGEVINWTLFVDEDSKGMHAYSMPFIKKSWPGLVGNVRASYEFQSDASGKTVMRSVPIVNELDPDQPKN
jgi:hypothetical protein